MAEKKLKVTLIKSTIGAVPKNKKTIEALGLSKLYKTVAERKKHDRCRYIKAAVDHGNSHSVCRCVQKGKMNDRIDRIKDDHKNNGTDNIKVKMDQCRALCVL